MKKLTTLERRSLRSSFTCAAPNGWRTEIHVNNWLTANAVYKNSPELADGWVTLNEKPGLGLELNEEAVKEFKTK